MQMKGKERMVKGNLDNKINVKMSISSICLVRSASISYLEHFVCFL